ncbi:hypothetical protein BC751_2406 [Cecembia calidifontis]|jgi:hypothetical protein|uniref:Uncharacterized protein n=1 Tax=Cecembia calidifontis TaxID=1187080 RepID=A0A4Q7PDD5_9BACT|nr:hypothetical protein BC751_2406 [Cecembia calidifontis]
MRFKAFITKIKQFVFGVQFVFNSDRQSTVSIRIERWGFVNLKNFNNS